MNTAVQTIYVATTLAPYQAQLLLTLALCCLVLGVLLVEKRTLLRLVQTLSLFGTSRPAPSRSSL